MTENPLSTATATPAGQTIGLIGAGRIGTGIGLSLLRHGAELHIKANKNRTGAEGLIRVGAYEHTPLLNWLGMKMPSFCHCLRRGSLPGQHGVFAHLPRQSVILDCTISILLQRSLWPNRPKSMAYPS
ncbi:hypothetical protein ACFIOY_19440 [Bradyrhizobium sp. TZ2]